MIINPYYKHKAMTVNYKLLRTSGKLAQRKALRIVPIKKDITGIENLSAYPTNDNTHNSRHSWDYLGIKNRISRGAKKREYSPSTGHWILLACP